MPAAGKKTCKSRPGSKAMTTANFQTIGEAEIDINEVAAHEFVGDGLRIVLRGGASITVRKHSGEARRELREHLKARQQSQSN